MRDGSEVSDYVLIYFCDFPIKQFFTAAYGIKKNTMSYVLYRMLWQHSLKCEYQPKHIIMFGDGEFFIKFKSDFLNVYFLNHF